MDKGRVITTFAIFLWLIMTVLSRLASFRSNRGKSSIIESLESQSSVERRARRCECVVGASLVGWCGHKGVAPIGSYIQTVSSEPASNS
jgi:hypothetical protein